MIFTKKCAKCGSKFNRIGCAPGNFGYLGRIIGGLTFFILFGGTSKYCPSCREALKQQNEMAEDKSQKVPLDKDFSFRLAWLGSIAIIVIIVLVIIETNKVNAMLR